MADAGLIALCASSALLDGGVALRFELRADGQAASAFAVRYQGRVYAYLNRCAHRALELDWLPGQVFDADGRYLVCATHGALFEPASGHCAGGPCDGHGGLRPLSVIEQDGTIYWKPDP